jgi:hypothetical protein
MQDKITMLSYDSTTAIQSHASLLIQEILKKCEYFAIENFLCTCNGFQLSEHNLCGFACLTFWQQFSNASNNFYSTG